MLIVEHPRIYVSFKKFIENHGYWKPDEYIKRLQRDNAGMFYPNSYAMVLSYGEFFKRQITRTGDSIERQTAKTIMHEFFHAVLLKEHNWKVTYQFDRIARKLEPYGLW